MSLQRDLLTTWPIPSLHLRMCVRACACAHAAGGGEIDVYIDTHTTLRSTMTMMRKIIDAVLFISSATNARSQSSSMSNTAPCHSSHGFSTSVLWHYCTTEIRYRILIAVADLQGVYRGTTRQMTGRACAPGCRTPVYTRKCRKWFVSFLSYDMSYLIS